MLIIIIHSRTNDYHEVSYHEDDGIIDRSSVPQENQRERSKNKKNNE